MFSFTWPFIRLVFGRSNLATKTLIDRRFLIWIRIIRCSCSEFFLFPLTELGRWSLIMSCDHIFTFWSDQKLFVSWHCCCCVFWNTCKVFTINRWTEHIIWIKFIQMRDLLLKNEYREVFLTEVVMSWKHAVSSINCMWMPLNDFLYHQWSHCSTIKKETTQDMFSLDVRTVNENI